MARSLFQEPVFGVRAARSEEFAVKEEGGENQKDRRLFCPRDFQTICCVR